MATRKFFDDEVLRRRWQNPEAILAEIGLRSGSVFMDIGCGTGFFAFPAAQIVGKNGSVYALDKESWAAEQLGKTAVGRGLRNLNLKVGEAEQVVFCEGCADFVFYGIVLHDFRYPLKALANAKRMLKPTGNLIDLDWKKMMMPFGPPLNIRFSEEQAVNLIEKASFKVEAVRESGPFHYLITAKP